MTTPLFLDTNVFLRYLTDDIPEEADRIGMLLEQAAAGEVALVTNVMVLAEIVWTLESFYGEPKGKIREQVLAILNTPGLDVEDAPRVLRSVLWYVEKNIDFIDAYNAAWMIDHDLDSICTFDRKHFRRIEGLQVGGPGEFVS